MAHVGVCIMVCQAGHSSKLAQHPALAQMLMDDVIDFGQGAKVGRPGPRAGPARPPFNRLRPLGLGSPQRV